MHNFFQVRNCPGRLEMDICMREVFECLHTSAHPKPLAQSHLVKPAFQVLCHRLVKSWNMSDNSGKFVTTGRFVHQAQWWRNRCRTREHTDWYTQTCWMLWHLDCIRMIATTCNYVPQCMKQRPLRPLAYSFTMHESLHNAIMNYTTSLRQYRSQCIHGECLFIHSNSMLQYVTTWNLHSYCSRHYVSENVSVPRGGPPWC